MKVKLLLLAIVFFGLSLTAFSQTTLVAGDIAIVGYNTDDPDTIRFVALRDLQAGTVFSFTDNGWLNTGAFRTGEGIGTYTAPGAITAGTTITFVSGSAANSSAGFTSLTPTNFALAASGDSITVYQGTLAAPTLIYAVSTGIAWAANATDSNTSAEPIPANNGTLATGVTTLQLSDATLGENGFYNGTTTGTKDQLLASISNPANWTQSGTPIPLASYPSAFTVNQPTAAFVSISGRIITPQDRLQDRMLVTLTDMAGQSRTILAGKSGGYRFREVAVGETYILTVNAKGYSFSPKVITVTEDMTEVNFEPNE